VATYVILVFTVKFYVIMFQRFYSGGTLTPKTSLGYGPLRYEYAYAAVFFANKVLENNDNTLTHR